MTWPGNVCPGYVHRNDRGLGRQGRMFFYGCDELPLRSDWPARALPEAGGPGDEGDGPWCFVGDRDIFPEEFRGFLGLRGEL